VKLKSYVNSHKNFDINSYFIKQYDDTYEAKINNSNYKISCLINQLREENHSSCQPLKLTLIE
jgi:hypothetical protein